MASLKTNIMHIYRNKQITTFDMKPSHGKTKDGKPSGFSLRPRRLGVPSWSPENKSFRDFFVDVFGVQKYQQVHSHQGQKSVY